MPRLIDADDLLMDNSWAFYDENGNRNEACIAVENAPTVDAEPVIRCKDCKWWKTKYMRNGERKVCVIEAYEPVRNEDEYCSWAERREKMPIKLDGTITSPIIDFEPVRHGRWKGKPIAGYSTVKCSVCGEVFLENSGQWNFCPNCGAKMDEVEE